MSFHLDTGNCSSCTLLAVDDICTTDVAHHCNRSQIIYCCSGCRIVTNMCLVKGTVFEFSDDPVESRISFDAETLLITTASNINSSSCTLQTHRIGADGFTFSGPIQTCDLLVTKSEQAGVNTILTTTTFSPESATLADVVTVVDSEGGVRLYNLTSRRTLSYIPMNIQNDVLSISTTVQTDCLLVAILQPSRFYALRLNLISGELRESSWTGETLMLWYVDRSGVNIVQFQFKWDSNDRR
ncbi:hypothetical protein KIN20_018945 [Parelaphostrongylus tenuis]|uniref:Uncharacterized protein n=1 Tax=Parelaphostrongylus tenuis TaxID=148309 RepID=A0AAD5N4U6_PARTN|nr:hypothetical protein KIN20_018945 [Parelaphostrongylus tenuis]